MNYFYDGKTSVPAVFRVWSGFRPSGGPQQSQSNEAMFAHVAGLKVVMPSNGYDLKGLLKTAIQEKSQIEKDKSNDDKSYKKRIALWNDRKDHLANIVRTLSQVEGTKMTTNLIQIQDGIEDIDDE